MPRKSPDAPAPAVRSLPGRPRKLTRDRIIEAAVQVLEEDGFGALTMRGLAQRLGVNHATLYNYAGHIEDIETEALSSLVSGVPIPDGKRPEPMRDQLIEHLLALRTLQFQHPNVLHAPIGSPTWVSHIKNANRALHALLPHASSLVEASIAYNVLTATMASSAERARANGSIDYAHKQRPAILGLPVEDAGLYRKALTERERTGPAMESLPEVLDYLIDRLLPKMARRKVK